MWSIDIQGTTPFNTVSSFPKENIWDELVKASKENPTVPVTLWGHARRRATLLNGEYVANQPNLSFFYILESKREIADAIVFAAMGDAEDWHDDESYDLPEKYEAMDVPTIHRLLTETIEAADPIVIDGKIVK